MYFAMYIHEEVSRPDFVKITSGRHVYIIDDFSFPETKGSPNNIHISVASMIAFKDQHGRMYILQDVFAR